MGIFSFPIILNSTAKNCSSLVRVQHLPLLCLADVNTEAWSQQRYNRGRGSEAKDGEICVDKSYMVDGTKSSFNGPLSIVNLGFTN